MTETQESISQWAEATFGPVSSNARVAARANEEMAELLRALSTDDRHPRALEECADVVIVLCRLATRIGLTLQFPVSAGLMCPTGSQPGWQWATWANEHLARLMYWMAFNDGKSFPAKLRECVACLFGLAQRHLGADLCAEIDRKMQVNRARVWSLDGSGHGYHVRAKEGS